MSDVVFVPLSGPAGSYDVAIAKLSPNSESVYGPTAMNDQQIIAPNIPSTHCVFLLK